MKNNKVVIDSNIFYAALNKEDSLHNEAIKLIEEFTESIIIVPYSILLEVSTLLCYRQWKKKADEFIKTLQESNNIFIVSNFINDDIDNFLEIKSKISFADVSLISICKEYNAILASFDKQLLKIYKKML